MTDECSHVNATWICRPYHNGPLGRPQPFSTIHGEWGPPIPKISTIDWELYTVCLVLSDFLISAVSFLLIKTAFQRLRIRFLSSTFRFSLLIIFGALRMSMISYFFRAEPDAVIQYIYSVSFFVHCSVGMGVLLFQEGPRVYIFRPNSVGMYSWYDTGIPKWFVRAKNMVECNVWGVVQYFVSARTLLFSGFRLLPASAIDISLNNMTRLRERVSAEMPDVPKWTGNSQLFGNRTTKAKAFLRDYKANHLKDLIVTTDYGAESCSPKQPIIKDILKASPTRNLNVETKSSETTTDSKWSLEEVCEPRAESEESGTDIALLGPGNMKITVSLEKWNESILYWAKPSLESYFSKATGLARFGSPRKITQQEQLSPESAARCNRISSSNEPLSPSDIKRNMKGRARCNSSEVLPLALPYVPRKARRKQKWSSFSQFMASGFDDFAYGSDDYGTEDETKTSERTWCPPVRGTITLRGDGAILSISPSPPNIRTIVKQAMKCKVSKAGSSRQIVVELLGRKVVCKSKSKVIYMYAEFRRFGMELTKAQRKTLLWLMNQLNDNIHEMNLRAFRAQSFVDEHGIHYG